MPQRCQDALQRDRMETNYRGNAGVEITSHSGSFRHRESYGPLSASLETNSGTFN